MNGCNPTSFHSYQVQCVESFLAETRAHIQLEEHFQTCPECEKLHPEVCDKAKQIIEQSKQPEEKGK